MPIDLSILDPQEIVVLAIALAGLVPVAAYYRKSSKWFVIAYGFLVAGAIATNAENVILPEFLNFLEHSVGNLGAGIAFAVAAYKARRQIAKKAAGERDGEVA